MAKSLITQFAADAGTLGITSALFGVLLYAVSWIEHLRNHNISASLLTIASAVAVFLGCFLAWKKERALREQIQGHLYEKLPCFEFEIGPCIWKYDEHYDMTLFFPVAWILNRGHASVTDGWQASYSIGEAKEQMEGFYLTTPYVLRMGNQQLTISNEDLLTVKTSEKAIDRGSKAQGRLLFTLRGNRARQLEGANYRIDIQCMDYMKNVVKASYSPSLIPQPVLLRHANEKTSFVSEETTGAQTSDRAN